MKEQRDEGIERVATDESSKRNLDEGKEDDKGDRNWKKKKLSWLRTISKIPGVTPISKVQVVEIYSPERVCKVAEERGLKVGLSMDFVTGWNFDKKEDRELAEKYVKEYKPLYLIGSPMCTMFSQLQALNKPRSPERS